MTYREICAMLKEAGIEDYGYEASLLIEEICGVRDPEGDFDSEALVSAVKKRCTRYPLQYILGKWWFARCEFFVNESCLAPRPDTELLVELAAKLLPQNAVFADLCTGSGCIAISVLDLRNDTRVEAYELYPETLKTATLNAEHNKVADRFSPILGDVLKKELLGDKKFAAIISNPPYIRTEIIDSLEKEVLTEPRAALDGGEDGLIFYRAIVENFAVNLEKDGFFLFEIGYDQADDLRNIAEKNDFSCEIYRDLGGNDRAALLKAKQ